MEQIWTDTSTGLRARCEAVQSATVENEWHGRLTIVDPPMSSVLGETVLMEHIIPTPDAPHTEWFILNQGWSVWCEAVAGVQADNEASRYLTYTAAVFEDAEHRLGLEIQPYGPGGFRYQLVFWWPGDVLPRPPRSGVFTNARTAELAGRAHMEDQLRLRGVEPTAVTIAWGPRTLGLGAAAPAKGG